MNTAIQLVQAACNAAAGIKTIQRNYIQTSKAWYASSAMPDHLIDSINIQVIESDCLIGEFSINWPRSAEGYKIEIWNDAFFALSKCADLFDILAGYNDQYLNADQVCALLNDAGFTNATPRK